MKLRTGQTLVSLVDDTTVVVVRAATGDVEVTCGGTAMVDGKAGAGVAKGSPDPEQLEGTLIGKRYADEELGLELLCTRGGAGTLTCNGVVLEIKGAKPLPASD